MSGGEGKAATQVTRSPLCCTTHISYRTHARGCALCTSRENNGERRGRSVANGGRWYQAAGIRKTETKHARCGKVARRRVAHRSLPDD